MQALSSRQRLLLYAVTQDYILTGEPVGSKRLVERYHLPISPATVRNELSLLEEMGYLEQPHTSAGRIPTDKGYRYYVDVLMKRRKLTVREREPIRQFYAALNKEMEDLLRETSFLLSDLTKCVAAVLAPSLKESLLKHLDLVYLGPRAVLLVIITDTGRVEKSVVEFTAPISEDNLKKLEQFLNKKFSSLSFEEIYAKKDKALGLLRKTQKELAEKVINQVIEFLLDEEDKKVFLDGASNILYYPEFKKLEKVKTLLEILEHGQILLGLLREALGPERVIVRIGRENRYKEMVDCSLVAAGYGLHGKIMGTVGILGPTRMNYARAISAVEYISDNLSSVLESIHG